MKIAVLGVGLIGGSIGLAARARLGAEVAGFDPEREVAGRALERGAISEAAASVSEACAGAELVFCAAPVRALPELVAAALAATGEGTVITDVGSTKRELVDEFAQEPRFIGGHPLAGAETAGVDNARADLFEGARWYLTPAPLAEGMLYERVQGAIADLGARPQAIGAEDHDRLMATVSHLPHVLANVLVGRAQEAVSGRSERLPEVGPSFRDASRVAGANPSIWGEILAANREAVADEIEAVVERLRAAAALLRAGDLEAISSWHREAGDRRRELLRAELAGGPLHEVRAIVPNRPGIVAELALALGDAGVNIEDMSLDPAADMRSGAISIWVAGEPEARRAAERIGRLGHDVSLLAP